MMALAAVFCSIEVAAQNNFEIKIFVDRDSGAWNNKKTDYALLAEVDGCRIKWNAVEEKDETRSLVLHRTCNIPFSQ